MTVILRPQGKLARYFTHAVGRTGDEIPLYPDWLWPWWTVPLSALGLALLIFVAGIVRGFRSVPVWDWRWDSLFAALPLLAVICLIGSVAVFAVMIGFWPVTRNDLGRYLERQIDGWPLPRLEEEISKEGAAWRASRRRLAQAHLRRLIWLYRKREELHRLKPPPHFQTTALADAH